MPPLRFFSLPGQIEIGEQALTVAVAVTSIDQAESMAGTNLAPVPLSIISWAHSLFLPPRCSLKQKNSSLYPSSLVSLANQLELWAA